MTYYLKYRPQKISELDIVKVRESLEKIVKSASIPHAFLFAGPKGTGKTSAARILAKVVNCDKNADIPKEPCNKCKTCKSIEMGTNLDVIEIDAASHRGIDDVRAIKESVKLAPAESLNKVFIIDEAHMLTTEASNALLKTLEEPPDHVMFILATTNPEKLISTIRSRTTIINFSKATTDEVVSSLVKITKGEKLPYKKDTLEVIAKSSDGSFRDATKILEQLVTEKIKPKTETVEEFVTNNAPITGQEILDISFKGDVKEVLTTIEKSVEKGVIAEEMLDGMIDTLHTEMLAKEGVGGEVVFDKITQQRLVELLEYLMEAKRQISTVAVEHLPIEIALVKWMEADSTNGVDDEEEEIIKIEEIVKKEVKTKEVEKPPKQENKAKPNSKIKYKDFNNEVWLKILDQMRGVNYTIEALLRASKPMDFDGETLRLGVFYKFHKERLEEIRNLTVLEDVVAKVMAKPTKVKCVLTEPEKVEITKESVANVADPKTVSSQDEDIVQVAKDIFGS